MSEAINIHWYKAELDDETVLSVRERERAARFRDEQSRRTFVTARTALRQLLAERLSVAPELVDIQVQDGGKPSVSGCEFNLSHAGDWICIALGSKPLGVDVERIRERNWERLAPRIFSEAEQCRIAAADLEATAMWSAKEAVLKASGLGIRRELKTVDVSGVHRDAWCTVESSWYAQLLVAPTGYRAAIASAAPVAIRCNGCF